MTSFIVITICLAVLGLVLGSFAGATVWRLRARQLVFDDKEGERVNKAELTRLKPLTKGTFGRHDRSRCLHCGYTLHWYDLIPLVSWVQLKGKCRQCQARIGRMEPLIELGTAAYFVGSFLLWPEPLTSSIAVAHLVLWLIAGVVLAILFAYDAKWFLLPDVTNSLLAIIGLAVAVMTIMTSHAPLASAISALASVGILSGLYLVLYLASKGRWVGFGDVKLGLGLGLLLSDWRLALIALFAANLIGTLIVLPGMIRGKIKAKSRIPFGPLLIVGTIIAMLWGIPIADYYSLYLFL